MFFLPRRFTSSAVSAFVCLAFGAAAHATTWVNTNTQAISLNQATPLGAINPTTQIGVAVALQMQNAAALRTLVQQQNTPGSPSYNTAITPDQFNATYAPSTASAAAVQNYLTQSGFTNVAVEPNRLFVTATGSAAVIEAAFNTSLGLFSQNGKTVFVNTKAAQVPASLSGIVLSVLGLNNVQMSIHPTAVTPCDVSSPTCVRFTYNPATYWKTYDVGAVPAASGATIAIMAEGNVTQAVKDLRAFEAGNGLPVVPVKVMQVGLASPDTAGVDEWDIDTQYTTGMAGSVKTLYIYTTTSLSDSDVALEFNHWAHDDLAKAANASFGICEFFPFLDGSMLADDQVFLEAAAQGQTLFASTGDTGSFCPVLVGANGVPAGTPFVNYPATSTYAVGVGGTTLLSNTDGSYNGEVAWYAGGGGLSQFEVSPFWQQNVVPTNNPSVPATFRAIPDLSMDADPNTGAIVYMLNTADGKSEPSCCWGGTSLASPLAVGVWARLQNAYGNKLGFAPPRLYAGYPAFGTAPTSTGTLTEPADGFHDILTGANGFYTSLPYYDLTTGMGTFDVSAKKAVIPH
jgi:pseudomonalisin